MSVITSKAILSGGFIRTSAYTTNYHSHNNNHLVSTAVHEELCQDFDHFPFSQNPCTDSHFVDEENETEESNSPVHSFCYNLLPPS